MMGEHKNKNARRVSLPIVRPHYATETQYAWLPPVLDAHAIVDQGLANEIAAEEQKRGQTIACGKGCSACCKNADVPLVPEEVATLSWYVSEVMSQDTFDGIEPRLEGHAASKECPFLLNDACSVYPVRPLACRSLLVFAKKCAPEEDVLTTRAGDIFAGSLPLHRIAGLRLLDARGFTSRTAKTRAFEAGVIGNATGSMHQVDWGAFVARVAAIRQTLE